MLFYFSCGSRLSDDSNIMCMAVAIVSVPDTNVSSVLWANMKIILCYTFSMAKLAKNVVFVCVTSGPSIVFMGL